MDPFEELTRSSQTRKMYDFQCTFQFTFLVQLAIREFVVILDIIRLYINTKRSQKSVLE